MFFRSSHYNPFLFGKMLTSSVVISVGWKFSCGCLCMPLHSTHFPKITKKNTMKKIRTTHRFLPAPEPKAKLRVATSVGAHLNHRIPKRRLCQRISKRCRTVITATPEAPKRKEHEEHDLLAWLAWLGWLGRQDAGHSPGRAGIETEWNIGCDRK